MDREKLLYYLPAEYNNKIIVMESVDSTNSYLKRTASDCAEGTVVLALQQTEGRGRRGHTFLSDAGGLYLSMLVKPMDGEIATVTARTAVALCDAVESVCGTRPAIKWVNDLMLNNKKIGGILVESISVMGKIDSIIIGLGLNVNTNSLDLSITNIATSLKIYADREIDFEKLAAQVILGLHDMTDAWQTGRQKAFQQYYQDCHTLGQKVSFHKNGKKYRGIAIGLGEDFSLLVRTNEGQMMRLDSGEISVLPPEG